MTDLTFEKTVLDFSIKYRMCEPVSDTLEKKLYSEIDAFQTKVVGKSEIDRDTVALLFDFASGEPSNKYNKYADEEFDRIWDIWLNAVMKISEILNSELKNNILL